MRIGIISGEYAPLRGGISDSNQALVGALLRRGHAIALLTNPGSAESRPQTSLDWSAGWGLPCWWRTPRWGIRRSVQVVNFHYQTAMYGMSPWVHGLPKRFAAPCAVTFHDLRFPYLFPKAGDALRKHFVLALARQAALAIVTNHEDEASLHQAGIGHTALIPIGSGIEQTPLSREARAALRASLGLAEDELLWGHFGFLYPNRGVEALLYALRRQRDAGQAARLLMIGGREGGPTDDVYVARLDRLIAELGLSQAVAWTGYVEPSQASAWLQACDGLVLPFADGASYRRSSLMAAIQHACPILTTQPQVVIPTFEHGVNLWLVPPDDVDALTDGLTRLSDAALRTHLAQGVARLRQHFQWDDIAARYESAFAALLEKTP
ncbi:MAG: glycosyltransferase family 4 protein [Anaerolineae bacterium]|nr:glycosyltransferase family 4 protein [Anaerolineae bacterium]MDW8170880.1 glycosyltransferase family 4 protein [Anaerolineae bacterium]